MILEKEPEMLKFPEKRRFPQDISFSPSSIIRPLFAIVVVLSSVALILIVVKYVWNLNSGSFLRINRLLNLNIESNIPTFFSSLLLLFAAILLFFLFKSSFQKRSMWLILSCLFMFLCIDEAAQIHENLNKLTRNTLFLDETALKNVWVVPYLTLGILLAIFFYRFISNLPIKTRKLFVLSGLIFVTGAAGLEVIEGQLKIIYGSSDFLFMELLYWLEETLEMCGVILFIYALLDYIAPKGTNIFIKFTD